MTSTRELTAPERVKEAREHMLRVRAEQPGTGYALAAFNRYWKIANDNGMNPTTLRVHSRDEVERFFAYTVNGPDGHVYWTGGHHGFRNNQRRYRVPLRWWWEHIHGPIGTYTLRVKPICGDLKCINPEHAECKPFQAQRFTDEQILGAIQVVAMRLGRAPSRDDFAAAGMPMSYAIAILRFNGWSNAVRAAGLVPIMAAKGASADDAKAAILYAKDQLGRWPTSTDLRRDKALRERLQARGLPCWWVTIVRDLGGTWEAALKAAGKRSK